MFVQTKEHIRNVFYNFHKCTNASSTPKFIQNAYRADALSERICSNWFSVSKLAIFISRTSQRLGSKNLEVGFAVNSTTTPRELGDKINVRRTIVQGELQMIEKVSAFGKWVRDDLPPENPDSYKSLLTKLHVPLIIMLSAVISG